MICDKYYVFELIIRNTFQYLFEKHWVRVTKFFNDYSLITLIKDFLLIADREYFERSHQVR